MNGDPFQNIAKILEMMGGIERYVGPTDVVVIKGNSQNRCQGYTHTGCIKAIADAVLGISGFSGEVLICDNAQNVTVAPGFEAGQFDRWNNWPDHNWNSLAAEYQSQGKPVAATRWRSSDGDISGPADGEGWIRDFFHFENNADTYLSYPIFESPLTAGRMIDMQKGVWESGAYTGRRVRAIFMPTINNHGLSNESYAGVTSAIKSFFGATEIHPYMNFRGHRHIHQSSYDPAASPWAGHLVARYIQTMYSPIVYITPAIYAGFASRGGVNDAVEAKTVYACENPATLDYIACRDLAARFPQWPVWLNPDNDYKTRRTILGMINFSDSSLGLHGIGTITPGEYEIISYDFNNPTVSRLDIDRMIKAHKEGNATEQEVKNLIKQYMETP